MYCRFCGRQIDGDAQFCTSCGKQQSERFIPVKKFCSFCDRPIDKDAQFCTHCGKQQPVSFKPVKLYCRFCGKQIDEDAKFCTYCGKQQSDGRSKYVVWFVNFCKAALALLLSFVANVTTWFPKFGRCICSFMRKYKKLLTGVAFVFSLICGICAYQKAALLVQKMIYNNNSLNTDTEDKDAYDYNLNRWKDGLAGLDSAEREIWMQTNASKIKGKTEDDQDRLWRNQQFVNVFGLDTFNKMRGRKDDRDKLYYDYITKDALIKKYGDKDPNMLQFMSLTPEGREELLRSDYMGENQLQKNEKIDQNKSWWDYSFKERGNAIASKAADRALTGLWGSLAGLPGAVIGVGAGLFEGTLEGLWHPEDAYDINKAQKRKDNADILHKIEVADNNRKKEESEDEISKLRNSYYIAYAQGRMTDEEINKAFDNIALNGKRTVVDELGNATARDYTGSNYYSAFKDCDEFEHFSVYDKLDYLAQTEVLSEKYGRDATLRLLDQDLQDDIANQQNWISWIGKTFKNIGVGTTTYLMRKGLGLTYFISKL